MMSEVRPPPAPDLPQLPRSPSLHAMLTTPVDRTGACRFLPYPRGLPRDCETIENSGGFSLRTRHIQRGTCGRGDKEGRPVWPPEDPPSTPRETVSRVHMRK